MTKGKPTQVVKKSKTSTPTKDIRSSIKSLKESSAPDNSGLPKLPWTSEPEAPKEVAKPSPIEELKETIKAIESLGIVESPKPVEVLPDPPLQQPVVAKEEEVNEHPLFKDNANVKPQQHAPLFNTPKVGVPKFSYGSSSGNLSTTFTSQPNTKPEEKKHVSKAIWASNNTLL